MRRLSRRQFLIGVVAASSGALVLDACVPSPLAKRAKIGAYVNLTGAAAEPIPHRDLTTFEHEISGTASKHFDVIQYYFPWNSPFQAALNPNVPERQLMISWLPTGSVVSGIPSGTQDGYIAEYARAAKRYGHRVWLRFAPEMNGSWSDYSAAAHGPSAHTFGLAWHRVVGIFRRVGADNVKFVWCPNEVSFPNTPGNAAEAYWPGSEWVDVIGFDAFNWGGANPSQRGTAGWRSFDRLVSGPYRRLSKLDGSLPVWLCETGCPEPTSADPHGVTKGAWFQDMFASTSYSSLDGVVYFSSQSSGRDWRINSSSDAVAGWRKGWTS